MVFAWPVFAKEVTEVQTQSSFFVVAYNTPPEAPKQPSGGVWNSCVVFARYYTGRDDIRGNAGDLEATAQKPYVGGLVLTTESKWGHVAVIRKIEGDTLYLIEGNWIAGQVSTRSLDVFSPLIRGFK